MFLRRTRTGLLLIMVMTACAAPAAPSSGTTGTALTGTTGVRTAPATPATSSLGTPGTAPTSSAGPSRSDIRSSTPLAGGAIAADCDFEPADPDAPPAASDPAHAAALAAVTQEVSAFPIYPGARRSAAAPSSDLARPAMFAGSPDQVCANEWFLTTGSAAAVMTWYSRHVPVTMTEGSPGGGPPSAIGSKDVMVMALPVDGRVGIAVFGARTWIRTRPAWTLLAGFSGSVQLTTVRPGHPTLASVTRSLSGVAVGRLVAAVDALASYPAGFRSCPMDDGDADTLVFRSGTTQVATVTVGLTGCASVRLSVPGHPDEVLDGATGLNDLIVALFGLPAGYRDR